MYLTEDERSLRLRQVAWVRTPAGEDRGGRLSLTHYAAGDDVGQVLGPRTLCGRALPSEWDIAGARFEHYGNGVCRRCLSAFQARLAPPQGPGD